MSTHIICFLLRTGDNYSRNITKNSSLTSLLYTSSKRGITKYLNQINSTPLALMICKSFITAIKKDTMCKWKRFFQRSLKYNLNVYLPSVTKLHNNYFPFFWYLTAICSIFKFVFIAQKVQQILIDMPRKTLRRNASLPDYPRSCMSDNVFISSKPCSLFYLLYIFLACAYARKPFRMESSFRFNLYLSSFSRLSHL